MTDTSIPRRRTNPNAMAEASTVFVAMNPAVNIFFRFKTLALGTSNRSCGDQIECPDGKALNAAKAFKHLGGRPTVVMISAGRRGKVLEHGLRKEAIAVKPVAANGECRRIYTLLSGDSNKLFATHLIEPGPRVHPKELSVMADTVSQECESATACVLAGSLPPGTPDDFYARIIREIRRRSRCAIIVDTSGEALRGAAAAGPEVIKINLEEFASWASLQGNNVGEIKRAMASICDVDQIDHLIVTRGGRSAIAYCRSGRFLEATPPKVRVVNPVGAGDGFIAGMAFHLKDGFDVAFKMGIAAGTAAVMSFIPGDIKRDAVDGLSRRILLKLSSRLKA
jgi:1-phosphofructokinase family hexose kinase